MARNLNPKCKQCRREGTKLFIKGDRCYSPKCAMVKRNFPPGVHGVKGYGRLTGYGQQIREKQKVKRIYQILETQMKNYFLKASQTRGNTEESLLQLLEMRFDNIVYRIGLTKSRNLARQLITHNHFLINNKKVNIPSYQLKIGDIVKIKEKSKKIKLFGNLKEQFKNKEQLSWLFIDPDKIEIKVTGKPTLEENKGEFDLKLIIEFYSK
ncbi:MAG: 30S ribosomal protein S4 [Candidatus Buchananbacteria bacterium RBG_13_36_9]|uniref:Small ribosomal subunit protein uS4 n=1 Tax=Candidatus Buchananbacteria bacterium RBG_13_36_9 TaxID=1797530 RepID=A0A1G1XSX3_9BACT|nr:MAG: 30S ribosomal protein S4 [Candidatus Buchananbacteria bacterium RBG_13_36_9]